MDDYEIVEHQATTDVHAVRLEQRCDDFAETAREAALTLLSILPPALGRDDETLRLSQTMLAIYSVLPLLKSKLSSSLPPLTPRQCEFVLQHVESCSSICSHIGSIAVTANQQLPSKPSVGTAVKLLQLEDVYPAEQQRLHYSEANICFLSLISLITKAKQAFLEDPTSTQSNDAPRNVFTDSPLHPAVASFATLPADISGPEVAPSPFVAHTAARHNTQVDNNSNEHIPDQRHISLQGSSTFTLPSTSSSPLHTGTTNALPDHVTMAKKGKKPKLPPSATTSSEDAADPTLDSTFAISSGETTTSGKSKMDEAKGKDKTLSLEKVTKGNEFTNASRKSETNSSAPVEKPVRNAPVVSPTLDNKSRRNPSSTLGRTVSGANVLQQAANSATLKPTSGADPNQSTTTETPTDLHTTAVPSVPSNAPQFGVVAPPSMFGGRYNNPSFSLTPTPYADSLEAYILCPVCEDARFGIEWSYKIQILPLRQQDIITHIRKLGPNYSVIESIGELLPEQLRLIQIRVKARQGNLLSTHHMMPTNMVTKIGTFPVKSVLFVLETSSTTKPDEEDDKKPVAPPLFGNVNENTSGGFVQGTSGFRGFGGFGPSTAGFGAFGSNNTPQLGFGATHGNGFVKNSENPFSIPSTLVTSSTSKLFGGGIQESSDGLAKYRRIADEAGDPCKYFERYVNEVHHYQSITANDPGKDLSYEELRLADIAAGRVGPPTQLTQSSNKVSAAPSSSGDPCDQNCSNPSHPSTAGGLFGQSKSSFVAHSSPPGHSTVTGCLFGAPAHSNHTTPSGGLFGAFGPASASTTSTQSSVFASTTQNNHVNTGGLFGAAAQNTSNASGGGLFSCCGSNNMTSVQPSLFGSTAQNISSRPEGVFGNASQYDNNAFGGGLFGRPPGPSDTTSPRPSVFRFSPSNNSLGAATQSNHNASGGALFGRFGANLSSHPPSLFSTHLHNNPALTDNVIDTRGVGPFGSSVATGNGRVDAAPPPPLPAILDGTKNHLNATKEETKIVHKGNDDNGDGDSIPDSGNTTSAGMKAKRDTKSTSALTAQDQSSSEENPNHFITQMVSQEKEAQETQGKGNVGEK